MNRSLYTFTIAMSFLLINSTLFASDVQGVTLRFSVYPDIARQNSNEQQTETSTNGSNATTEPRSSTTVDDTSQAQFNLGAGYTLSSGIHVGANVWQQTSHFKTVSTSSRSSSSTSSYTSKHKQVTTALGPTIGYVHGSGFSSYFTPFLSVGDRSEASSEYASTGYTPSEQPEPQVSNASKTSGYRVDMAYHFRFANTSVGPELSYTLLKTNIDVTTTEYDAATSSSPASSTTTHDTGSVERSRILPMIGMSYTL